MKLTTLLSIVFMSMSVLLNAQHNDHNDGHSQASGHGDDHAKKNHIAVFLGGTSNFDHHSTDFSVGLDYEYRLNKWLGLGLMGEAVFAASTELIAGVPLFFHPAKGLKLVIAPIGVFTEVHIDSHEVPRSDEDHYKSETLQEPHKEVHFGVRLGLGYDFHLGKLSVGPAINYDVSNTSALVYGINVGLGF